MIDETNGIRDRRAGWATLCGAGALVAFWVLYFGGVIDSGSDELTREFESAFPLADAALVIMLVAAGVSLLRGRTAGTFCLVAAAAASLYLGILDATFYGRQGHYFPLTGAGLFELAVNLLCIGGGAWGLRRGWTQWRRTLARARSARPATNRRSGHRLFPTTGSFAVRGENRELDRGGRLRPARAR